MKFDLVESKEFYEILYQDSEFCAGLGRTMMAAARLETVLRDYLRNQDVAVRKNATLGRMVNILKEKQLLSRNGAAHFDDLVHKRNYLAHSLYDLFSSEIEETILEREGLVKEDVDIFIYRAESLAKDFLFFVGVVSKAKNDGSPIV